LTLKDIASGIVAALNPDLHVESARQGAGLPPDAEPDERLVLAAKKRLLRAAAAPLASNGELREAILRAGQQLEQTIDTVSKDELLAAGYSEAARERARQQVTSFEAFIREHKDELTALQILYNQPYGRRMRFRDIKELAEAIKQPPLGLTMDDLWQAYQELDRSKVRGSGPRVLADLVSVIRFAIEREPELLPFREQVDAKFAAWLAEQESRGVRFSAEQRQWLEAIKEHIATSLEVSRDDFDEAPFNARGGLGRVYDLFGEQLDSLLEELNEVLAA
jgi:type I restriction enzyme R subunit